MKKAYEIIKNILVTTIILVICFILCLLLQNLFEHNSLIPAIFVLGVFLISVITQEYIFAITASLLSVLAVNFAFTFPYFAFNFTIPENIISAVILLIVTFITCGLTMQIKHQEAIKAENQQERMRANLLRAVSHDLRTPLTTIYSSSSVLLENYGEFNDEQNKQMLTGIKEDSQWLSRMVENLLSITRLDGANVEIIKTETVLDELVDSILVKFAKRYPHQEVQVDIPDDFISIPMDAILIEQVAINILENAVQHAEGMTKLIMKVFTTSNKAVFEIMDDGCGLPEEKQKTIFTGTYIRDEIPSDSRKNNAGIGLSVCASIIKAHGGDISVQNIKEGGCLFRFMLDLGDCANE